MRKIQWNAAKWVVVGTVLATTVWAQGVAYVITTQGQRIDGTDIRAKANGEIVLTTPQGTRTFYPGQYIRAVAPKPPEMDQAARLIEAKRFDEAIKLLEDVVVKFRFLDWDNQARLVIANAYLRKGDASSAVAAFEKLFAANPKSREDNDVMWAYRRALLEAGQYDKLEQQLQQIISSGPRSEAALAQIMRGDIKMAQGQVELAAMDYLRTVILFESEKAAQPEALWKAGQALEQLRDPRAKEMYKKLVTEFGSSPQAQAARAKL